MRPVDPNERTRRALEKARDHLLSLQDEAGWWKGDLDTNVTMDAEDVLMREFLGIRRDDETERTAAWIRSQQREDGTWAVWPGGPANLSVTVEAYVALRVAGDAPEAEPMKRAAEWIRGNGGLEGTRVFTRIWMALFGQWSWDDLPALPPEMILLPKWFPLNIYDFACWARQSIVALTVVASHRPCRPLPFRIDELRVGQRPVATAPLSTWKGCFQRLDRMLHFYERNALVPLRRLALRLAEQWILRRQEADGCWGGIQPPWVYSVMSLHLQGYPLDHPAIQRGLQGLEGFVIEMDGMRRLEACQSPVWDTGLAAIALRDAGVPATHPALRQAAAWLIDEEVRVPGDWAVRRPRLEPGGWAFEFENDNYPDVDDAAVVALALRGLEDADRSRVDAAVERGLRWTLGMQSSDGGWGAFDADNTRDLCEQLPFCDFGEVIDPPSADVTAHAVEMLAREGRSGDRATERGVAWLLREQEPDGSWFGRWGSNHTYGTGAVVPALIAAGVPKDAPSIRRAVRWLEEHQNADGGWGEDLRSYEDPAWRGRGDSTASQTAWCLMALLAAGERSGAVERGIAWLVDTQLENGDWDESAYTGTGFPGDFYIRYGLYHLVYPVMALGRYLEGSA